MPERRPTRGGPAGSAVGGGRVVSATRSTKPAQASTSSALSRHGAGSATTTRPSKPTTTTPRAPTASKQSAGEKPDAGAKVTDAINAPPASSKQSSAKASPAPAHPALKPPVVTTDSLQIAAQLYPWVYMTSSLEEAFKAAESSAQAALQQRSKELTAQEADIADQRARYDAERVISFCDELSTKKFSGEAPKLVKAFIHHGSMSAQVTADALHLSLRTHDKLDHRAPLQRYNDLLTTLGTLRVEAAHLTTSIARLAGTDDLEPQPLVPQALSALLPLIHARTKNLISAQQLVLASKENVNMELQMEGLRLSASAKRT